jgi:phosphatidylserine/phosphatidylglycerophosphate/cardiolipin synthase-like enzyme
VRSGSRSSPSRAPRGSTTQSSPSPAAGVRIRGVLDSGQANHGWAAPQWLRHSKIELRVPKKQGDLANLRKLHHKLMVIDDRIVIAGSNYT